MIKELACLPGTVACILGFSFNDNAIKRTAGTVSSEMTTVFLSNSCKKKSKSQQIFITSSPDNKNLPLIGSALRDHC